MVRLPDGRFLVFRKAKGGDSEASSSPAIRRCRAPGAASCVTARPTATGSPTPLCCPTAGCCFSTGGSACSKASGQADRRRPAQSLPSAALITGREVAAFEGRVTRDNMEALSVTREGGRTIVWIASDDNYNPLQRTLLLKFAWME